MVGRNGPVHGRYHERSTRQRGRGSAPVIVDALHRWRGTAEGPGDDWPGAALCVILTIEQVTYHECERPVRCNVNSAPRRSGAVCHRREGRRPGERPGRIHPRRGRRRERWHGHPSGGRVPSAIAQAASNPSVTNLLSDLKIERAYGTVEIKGGGEGVIRVPVSLGTFDVEGTVLKSTGEPLAVTPSGQP